MRCLLDMDEVLVDFVGGAAKLFDKDPASVTTWDIPPQWNMDPADFWRPLGSNFWLGLEILPWAAEVVALLEQAFGPHNICLLSSPCETKGCLEGKREWIRRNLPAYSRRFLLGPAKAFCASPHAVLIDDNECNVDAFHRAGGSYCLFPARWNRNREFAADPLPYLRSRLRDLLGGL